MIEIDELTGVMRITQTDVPNHEPTESIVDRYARIHNAHSALGKELESLKTRIVSMGASRLDGTAHYLAIASVNGSSRVDSKALIAHLGLPSEVVQKFTKTGATSTRITIYGV